MRMYVLSLTSSVIIIMYYNVLPSVSMNITRGNV